jgi:hypothetical protein
VEMRRGRLGSRWCGVSMGCGSFTKVTAKDEAIDPLLVGAPLAGVRSDSNQVILGWTSGLWKPWLPVLGAQASCSPRCC